MTLEHAPMRTELQQTLNVLTRDKVDTPNQIIDAAVHENSIRMWAKAKWELRVDHCREIFPALRR
jgi:hypothetical protein